MRTGRLFERVAILLATLGMCLPQLAFAQRDSDDASDAGGGGHRTGRRRGPARAGGRPAEPAAWRTSRSPCRRRTRKSPAPRPPARDSFTVQGLRGGVYQVAAGQGQGVYRLWTAERRSALRPEKRHCLHPIPARAAAVKMLLANPIVIAGLVATAIAVPVALANSSHSASP